MHILRLRSPTRPFPDALELSDIKEVGLPYFHYDIMTGFYRAGKVIALPDHVSNYSRIVVAERHPFIKHELQYAHRDPVNLGLISDEDGWNARYFCVSDNVPEKWRSFVKWLRNRRDDPFAQAASRQLGLHRDDVEDAILDDVLDDMLYGPEELMTWGSHDTSI